MELYKEYPNKELYKDVQDMINEINNPRDERTKELLEDEEKFDPRSDDVDIFVYAHFRKKYPKLENYTKPLFLIIIKEHKVDMNILQNLLSIREQLYGTGAITYEKATELFGKHLSTKFIEPLVDNPQEVRRKVNELYKNQKEIIKGLEDLEKDGKKS